METISIACILLLSLVVLCYHFSRIANSLEVIGSNLLESKLKSFEKIKKKNYELESEIEKLKSENLKIKMDQFRSINQVEI